jgi:hypothetical protein
MQQVRLIHWNEAEAGERAAVPRAAGYAVVWEPVTPEALRDLGKEAPAAVVIDLTRLPSHGRDVGLALRKQGATRCVPLVFAGGEPEKVARARALLPDACYTPWDGIEEALARAIAHRPSNPVVPASNLDGYSGTPLPRKLGIKPEYSVALLGAPEGVEATLGELPPGVSRHRDACEACDLILWFPADRAQLEARVGEIGAAAGAGGIWILWPKRASGVVSDLSESVVRETGLAAGLVDYKICAFDTTWSGLRFARRKAR